METNLTGHLDKGTKYLFQFDWCPIKKMKQLKLSIMDTLKNGMYLETCLDDL
jgi:hypothetical protein